MFPQMLALKRDLQFYHSSRRLQDPESAQGGDAVIATDISGGEHRGIARAAAGGHSKRDRGVCGVRMPSELRSPCFSI